MSDDAHAPGILDVADELYGLPLGDFTPERDARAKALKKPDAELSAAVKALRKPSLAAWVVNLLVRRDTAQVEQVLQVGALLREAQDSMSGDELRALTRQRRQLTAAVTTRARGLAREEGQRVTEAVAEQVEATLTAAMLDEHCGRALRSGLLVAALSATGVGESDAAGAVAVPEALGFAATRRDAPDDVPTPRPDLRVVPDPDADEKARAAAVAAAREALGTARSTYDEAVAAHEETTAAVSDLQARTMQTAARIDELRRRIAELEQESEELDDELVDAQEAAEETDAELADATRARDEAAAALERLEDQDQD